ncbi:hypothetical protein Leryth_006960 [Lithospermum erythrorhizon]|nr:hypothetical protein Leryth_006960 [Lithospermum erythrorhizon]
MIHDIKNKNKLRCRKYNEISSIICLYISFCFMGKSIPSPANFQRLTRLIISNRINKARPELKPIPKPTGPPKPEPIQLKPVGLLQKNMEMGNSTSSSTVEQRRFPLSAVVADCVKRWFDDTLKEAEGGDVSMQVLVGQMYSSGYGVPKNAHKGKAWIERASRSRLSALKVGAKRPGYNVSDSDSDDGKDEGK